MSIPSFQVVRLMVVETCNCRMRIKFHWGLSADRMEKILGGLLSVGNGAILLMRSTTARCAALIRDWSPKFAKGRI